MIGAHYKFARGATIRIPIDFAADDGETMAVIDTIEAAMRWSRYFPNEVVLADLGEPIAMTPVERSTNAGWFMDVAAEVSATLPLGFYAASVKATAGDSVIFSEFHAVIEITEPVTGDA